MQPLSSQQTWLKGCKTTGFANHIAADVALARQNGCPCHPQVAGLLLCVRACMRGTQDDDCPCCAQSIPVIIYVWVCLRVSCCLQAQLTPLQRKQLQVLEALADTFDTPASEAGT
jgi:hypothetical protein